MVSPAARRLTLCRRGRLASLTLAFALLWVLVTASHVAAEGHGHQLYDGFHLALPTVAATAVDIDSRSVLYDDHRETPLPTTLAARLLLVLLACERFAPDDTITLSPEIVALDDEKAKDEWAFQAGQRVNVDLLVLRALTTSNDAPLAALAALFHASSAQLLDMMTARAETLGLSATTIQIDDDKATLVPRTPVSSLSDLTRLSLALFKTDLGRQSLETTSRYVPVGSEGQRRIVTLFTPLNDLKARSNGAIEAGYVMQDDVYHLAMGFAKSQDHIAIMALCLSERAKHDRDSVPRLVSGVESHYVRSALVRRGEKVPSLIETAENGETFGLVYLDDVDYTHPKGDAFLSSSFHYVGTPPYRLPLPAGVATGKVTFELKNGYPITVSVGPDHAILSENKVYATLLTALQQNENVRVCLMLCLGLLAFVLAAKTVKNVVRAYTFYRLGGRKPRR